MPSLYQIRSANDYTPEKKSILSNGYLHFALFLAIVAAGYYYYIQPKFYHIPEQIFANHDNVKFLQLFGTPSKKIVWFGADCPVSATRRDVINIALNQMKLDKLYEQRPFLQDRLTINCKDCLDSYIMDKCHKNICIILPATHKIIKTDEKRLLSTLQKYKNIY